MSPASKRVRFMSGILECGSSRNVTRPDSPKFGRLAISSKGGASAFASRWSLATTWHAAHQRTASRSPFEASAASAGWVMTAARTPNVAPRNAAPRREAVLGVKENLVLFMSGSPLAEMNLADPKNAFRETRRQSQLWIGHPFGA